MDALQARVGGVSGGGGGGGAASQLNFHWAWEKVQQVAGIIARWASGMDRHLVLHIPVNLSQSQMGSLYEWYH